MNTRLWIVFLIVVAWTSFLIGYSVSALTGVKTRPAAEVMGASGGYGGAAEGSKAESGGYGGAAGGSKARTGGYGSRGGSGADD